MLKIPYDIQVNIFTTNIYSIYLSDYIVCIEHRINAYNQGHCLLGIDFF